MEPKSQDAVASPALQGAADEARREAARLMGMARSAAKAAAARENGKAGGRKKGTPQSPETRAKIAAAMKARRQAQGGKSAL